MMNRRTALLAPWLLGAAHAHAQTQAADIDHLATAWRVPDADPTRGHHVGVLRLNWADRRIDVVAAVPVPSRAHGLLAMPDGGFVALANRPGQWLLRADAAGRVMQMKALAAEEPARSLNGHALLSADAQWLFTTETDVASGAGWLSVRDVRSLARVAQLPSHGVDPHQLLLHPGGDTLMVANGGITRDALGRKRAGEAVVSSLVQIDARGGQLLGRWQLPDPWLSLRHLAWSSGAQPQLGIALQAEHEAAAERQQAPALAVWDGQHARTLHVPATSSGGYAGDICAGPAGGFVISAQKQGRCWWWHPAELDSFTLVADITEPCALVGSDAGRTVHMPAARGLARWRSDDVTDQASAMMAWPFALAVDNHAVRLLAA